MFSSMGLVSWYRCPPEQWVCFTRQWWLLVDRARKHHRAGPPVPYEHLKTELCKRNSKLRTSINPGHKRVLYRHMEKNSTSSAVQ